MKYELREQKYYELFFQEVYEITIAADACKITPTRAVVMINKLIDHVEDLTCETPIVDYEKEIVRFQAQFDEAEKTYNARESDLVTLLARFHKELRLVTNTKPK